MEQREPRGKGDARPICRRRRRRLVVVTGTSPHVIEPDKFRSRCRAQRPRCRRLWWRTLHTAVYHAEFYLPVILEAPAGDARGVHAVGTLSLRFHHHTALSLSLCGRRLSAGAARFFTLATTNSPPAAPLFIALLTPCVLRRVRRLLLVFCSSLSLSDQGSVERPREANIFILLPPRKLSNKAQKQ